MVNGAKPGMMQQQPGVNISEEQVKEAKPYACEQCGCTVFRNDQAHHQVKKISGLMIGQSMDVYVFPPVRHCAKCFEPIPDQPEP